MKQQILVFRNTSRVKDPLNETALTHTDYLKPTFPWSAGRVLVLVLGSLPFRGQLGSERGPAHTDGGGDRIRTKQGNVPSFVTGKFLESQRHQLELLVLK